MVRSFKVSNLGSGESSIAWVLDIICFELLWVGCAAFRCSDAEPVFHSDSEKEKKVARHRSVVAQRKDLTMTKLGGMGIGEGGCTYKTCDCHSWKWLMAVRQTFAARS